MASPCHCPLDWPAAHAVSNDAFRGILEPFGDESTAKEVREDSDGERRPLVPGFPAAATCRLSMRSEPPDLRLIRGTRSCEPTRGMAYGTPTSRSDGTWSAWICVCAVWTRGK
jgi:hypothetical protein